MQELIQQVIAGVANGSIYATLALALSLIHRATGVVNFAQGEMAMFSAFVGWSLLYTAELPYWIAFFIVLAISFFMGAGVYQGVVRPLARAGEVTIVIATIALLVIINGGAGWIWSTEPRAYKSPFPNEQWIVGDVVISTLEVGIIGVSIACVVLVFLLFRFTRLGLMMRASALRPATSRLLGIRVPIMLSVGWGLAAALGAVAGMMNAPIAVLEPNYMLTILVYSFAGAVLGGIDNPAGAVTGAYILGVGIALLGTYVDFVGESPELELPIALAVLLIVLLIRPAGLFGRVLVRRV